MRERENPQNTKRDRETNEWKEVNNHDLIFLKHRFIGLGPNFLFQT